MTKAQHGRDSIMIVEAMIRHDKKMPEILSHPLSSFLSPVQILVLGKLDIGVVIFCVLKKTKFCDTPGMWEIYNVFYSKRKTVLPHVGISVTTPSLHIASCK